MQPGTLLDAWCAPDAGAGTEEAPEPSVDSNSLKGIIHGLVTAYQEGQWSFIVLSHPSRPATLQPRGFLRSDSPATGLSQGDLLTRYLPCLPHLAWAPLVSPQQTQPGVPVGALSPGTTGPCQLEK